MENNEWIIGLITLIVSIGIIVIFIMIFYSALRNISKVIDGEYKKYIVSFEKNKVYLKYYGKNPKEFNASTATYFENDPSNYKVKSKKVVTVTFKDVK